MKSTIQEAFNKWPLVREGLLAVSIEHDGQTLPVVRIDLEQGAYYVYHEQTRCLMMGGQDVCQLARCESEAEKRVVEALKLAGINFEELYPVSDGWQLEAHARKTTLQRKLETAGFRYLYGEQGEMDGVAYSTVAFVPPMGTVKNDLEKFVEREFDRTENVLSSSERAGELIDAMLCIGDADRARLWLKGYGKDAGAIYAEQRPHENLQDCINRLVVSVVLGNRTPPSWVDIALDLQSQLKEAQEEIVALTDTIRTLQTTAQLESV